MHRTLPWLLAMVSLLAIPSPIALAQRAPFCQAGQAPHFVFGFAALRDQLGDVMGDPIECEHANSTNGDTLQMTTTGFSFYRIGTNTPTFTDGFNHWGLIDSDLVAWTGDSIDPPGVVVAEPVPQPVPAPEFAGLCHTVPVRGFGEVFATRPDASRLVGCPTYPYQEEGGDVAVQRFEHGWILRAPPQYEYQPPRIYALFEDTQQFAILPDTYDPRSDPVSTRLIPPPGLREPEGAIGKAWREGTGARVRERLGWAIEPAHAGQGAAQNFERGRMAFTPEPRMIFVLAEFASSDLGSRLQEWRAYPDRFTG